MIERHPLYDIIDSQLQDLINCEDLSDWESDFVASIEDQFYYGSKLLSDKQVNKLSDIWHKVIE